MGTNSNASKTMNFFSVNTFFTVNPFSQSENLVHIYYVFFHVPCTSQMTFKQKSIFYANKQVRQQRQQNAHPSVSWFWGEVSWLTVFYPFQNAESLIVGWMNEWMNE